eukprot:5262603-Pleurochrysis_carterae.AAC.2
MFPTRLPRDGHLGSCADLQLTSDCISLCSMYCPLCSLIRQQRLVRAESEPASRMHVSTTCVSALHLDPAPSLLQI